MTRSSRSILIACLLMLAVALAGCFGSASVTAPATSRTPAPVDSVIPVDSLAPAAITPTAVLAPVLLDIQSLVIGASDDSVVIDGHVGGTLSNGVIRIDVPSDAFVGTATIGFHMADALSMRADLHITPDSLNHFAKPVRLRFLCHGRATGSTGILWFEPTQAKWYGLTGSAYDSTSDEVSVDLRHFSTYGAGGRAGW